MNDVPKHPLLVKPLWTNTLTMIGLLLAAVSLLLLVTFGLFSIVSPAANPYVDIVGYLILPTMLVVGMVLMVLGIMIRSWRRRRLDPTRKFRILPRPDLSDPAQLRIVKYMAIGLFALLPITAVTGYHGYHFTDSTEFCGQTCHNVMQPESVTFERSSHARVACAECHIGSGASWFVKSKVSGLRQVVATVRESYHRPIPPAINELRPARETCEECHWPQKFYGSQLKQFPHYASDEQNTDRTQTLLLHIGGADEARGQASGIHRHMAYEGGIEYIAVDEKLQKIPWISWTDTSGIEHVYRSDGRPASDPIPEGERRTIDCMDCHNRPAHEFLSPQQSVDQALANGRMDLTLPWIKREAVAVLLPPYAESVEETNAMIGERISDFYRENYPEIWETRRAAVYQAIDTTREIFSSNVFPYMRVDWTTYPDNIGHLYSAGCARCHDNRHVNQEGEVIAGDCETCHNFLQASGSGIDVAYTTGPFVHPFEIEAVHDNLLCHQCHSGGASPVAGDCVDCHQSQQALMTAAGGFEALGIEPDFMAEIVACTDCHDSSTVHAPEVPMATCEFCHDETYPAIYEEYATTLDELTQQVQARMLASADPAWVERAQQAMTLLAAAGPLHNPEGSRQILEELLQQH